MMIMPSSPRLHDIRRCVGATRNAEFSSYEVPFQHRAGASIPNHRPTQEQNLESRAK